MTGYSEHNFLSAGFREVRRVFGRIALRQQLHRHDAQRDAALVALGETAWEEKLDLTPFGDLGERLGGVAARAGELANATRQLEAQKAAREAERKSELEKFQARRRAAEEKKRPVDASLKSARERHSGSEHSIVRARARLTALAGELEAVAREIESLQSVPSAESAAKLAAGQERQARLRTEQGATSDTLVAAEAELPGLAAEVARLQGEAERCAAEIAAIDSERNAIIARLDGELGWIRGELQTATQQGRTVGKEQSNLYRQLGQALYESSIRAPALAGAVERVATIDTARAETESRLQVSLSETGALPAGTMPRFWGVVVGVPLLVAAVGFGSYALVTRYPPSPAPTSSTVSPPARIDVEAEKDRAVQRFVQAGKGSDEQTRRSAVAILREDLLTMGATADPAHLPTLAKVLRSDAPELRAAAADAMGMIRPTTAETEALARLLQDPAAPVAEAARRALEASADPAARELAAKDRATKE